MRRLLVSLLLPGLMVVSVLVEASQPPPLEDLARLPDFKSVSLSPDGRHIAVAAPDGDRTGLAIIDISDPEDMELVSAYRMRGGEHVNRVFWATSERVLFTTVEQWGTRYRPVHTGRLYGMDLDGGNQKQLFGTRGISLVHRRFRLISLLPDDPDYVLISTYAHDRPYPFAERLNIRNGRTTQQASSPLENGALLSDHQEQIRFAYGRNEENEPQFAYRSSEDSEWTQFNHDFDPRSIHVGGFAPDNHHLYIDSWESGRQGLYQLDPETGDTTQLLDAGDVSITHTLYDRSGRHAVGVRVDDGRPAMHFVDEEEETARLQRIVQDAFEGLYARITSMARDTDLAIVRVDADIMPPRFFLFDTEALHLTPLITTRAWLDPSQMQAMEPVEFEARDGQSLHGYFTRPEGEGPYPMVVIVHGGPHGIRDYWGFDTDAQVMATRGYAVLQVNFRGSNGYGSDFEAAGFRNWGTSMQDDITDATRWAIDRGLADPDRVCIYGGSYGGYAALMGVAREPELYQCAFGYVGVYDLPLLHEKGDIPERPQGRAYLRRVVGDPDDEDDLADMKARSPSELVDRIQVPVYLAHGREDVRAHVAHYHLMVERLEEAEVPLETLLVKKEGHGFYKLENRVRLYKELLGFLDRHIGAQ